MNRSPSIKMQLADMVAVPLETTLGLALGILSTQFFPRQAPREPCYIRFEFFLFAAVLLSFGLPYTHGLLRQWTLTQRLAGLAIAGATFAFLFVAFGWGHALRSSWEEAW
jgi:hypothetical protein